MTDVCVFVNCRRWEAFALALGGLALPAITAALSRVCQRADSDPFSYR